ncbi:N-acetylglutaminylglutamine amidotransferase [Rhodospirillum rubrum]|uniref:asparagine synthase (glutamine-hydrolyzing) n=1 Tax=Rhodospirillum rubrum (strain ATCC 11170 / ATH 1.1.1 / DSM 467 / LMG 4362 / NCIMB 8255 / S1) TaxID=269796 RepID=Q2RSV6_RHORT|nr:N-acetylglutaminylglutamine amidotransferase [Rhodospirillum rubrum]ABC22789.1 Asparagine synthase, glutamine-hydrolyzing [Rhodospirillum rubrum ATCC 11170]MBK5954386.1 N-acetylglutaminylglutamine amidotransferase [Rhodospirillum rubrum]QXG78778.1 N-acetylglutaminylglutamine amidotransferase [Rhodospirillum rubrum]HAP98465.1 N-acetylglutaminylglutamine amidotransferase [Rhodospirillum rubrum]HCF17601.1 N-acetylglutaminylglutamine amidotransferase [Rhodospirillum rubrum]
MCGVCGEIRFDGQFAGTTAVDRMTAKLAPRGPDDGGILVHGPVALGHRRLSIIDLSPKAAQPMVDSDLGLSIVFNGCIYNYPALRSELEALGYRFFSGGDTEVILKAYHAWGTACVKRFNGMFAFAIHERDSGKVVLARDRFGIKPLYLAEVDGGLLFASSLPALLATGRVDKAIDPLALRFYISFHAVVPAPRTILKGVRKLPPATLRVVSADGSSFDEVYWRLDFRALPGEDGRSAKDWEDGLFEAVRAAVARRIIADVPVGVLLSGGLDSSLIVGLLAEAGQRDVETFSIGFEEANGEKGDEFFYSDLIAERYATRHHKIFIPEADMIAALPGAIAAMSEPMVSYDNVAFYLLAREVSKRVKVVLSGQGADEIFGGYHWYRPLVGSTDPVADYAAHFFDRTPERLARHLSPAWLGTTDEARAFVAAHFAEDGAPDPVDKALRLDSTVMLVEDPVKRVDNMTMAFGLEARVPFLDHQLAEFAGRIPSSLKLAQNGKGILKEVARRVVPAAVIDREKGYFPVPGLKYIEGSRLDYVRDGLSSRAARQRGLFREDYLASLYENPRDAITPLRGSELWQVGLLELWLQEHGI